MEGKTPLSRVRHANEAVGGKCDGPRNGVGDGASAMEPPRDGGETVLRTAGTRGGSVGRNAAKSGHERNARDHRPFIDIKGDL